ncbi:glycosyltransferase [Patescibacteria group bacterium]|nr:glycosyltransferase [Patescibacteria group bacterium]
MLKLSIVIPTKNEAPMLPLLLDSIKAQTFKEYEVIVADAHSTDTTRQIAEAFGARVVDGGMPGPGRNAGAHAAVGEVILFLDADVQLASVRFLEALISEMDRKKLDVATCRVKPLSRKPIDRALHEVYNAFAVATEKILPHAPGFCIFIRREAHEKIQGFDETVVFAEDHEYVQRAQKFGYRFGVLRSYPIAVSVRRLEKEGRLMLAFKYIYGEVHMLTKGKFHEQPFEYRMGGEDVDGTDTLDALKDRQG